MMCLRATISISLLMFCTSVQWSLYVLIPMQAYQFPDNVSFSFGGPGAAEYFVIETHYNNPSMVSSELFALWHKMGYCILYAFKF